MCDPNEKDIHVHVQDQRITVGMGVLWWRAAVRGGLSVAVAAEACLVRKSITPKNWGAFQVYGQVENALPIYVSRKPLLQKAMRLSPRYTEDRAEFRSTNLRPGFSDSSFHKHVHMLCVCVHVHTHMDALG